MKINMQEWVKSIIDSPKRLALPIMTHPGIEMTGHTVHEAVTDGEVHFQAIKYLSGHYPSIASTVIMDLTVEAEAFGAEIHFSENEVPSVMGRTVSDKASIEALAVPSVDSNRVQEYVKANRLMSQASEKPVIAGCIGPFSLAGRLYDMSEIMMGIYIDPEAMRILLDKCTAFIIKYCTALKSVGANAVLIAEPAAGLLSNKDCSEFSSTYVRRIVEAVQDKYFAVFLHNCGNRGQCTEAMVETGAMGFHFGNSIDMVEALDKCPKDALVMGNVDPVALFKLGTSEEVYKYTSDLLDKCANYPNFVISSGCDIPPAVPSANIDAFYQAVADYNNK
jgi:uroporphyrinogen decarboxylase